MPHPETQTFHEMFSPMEIIALATDQLTYDNKVYLFTWNPRPNFYEYRKIGGNNYAKQWVLMISVLKDLSRCSNCFCIVPEISDEGKIHCHGWFSLDDKLKWSKSVLGNIQRNGFMKINKLNTSIEKIDYYYKEIDDTKDVLSQNFYVLTHFTMKEVLKDIRMRMLQKKVKKELKTNWLIDRLFPESDSIEGTYDDIMDEINES